MIHFGLENRVFISQLMEEEMYLDPINQTKEEISLLKVELDRSLDIRKRMERKMNDLACLTSDHLFVAVVNGKESRTCGVAKECVTRLFHLIFTTTGDGVIRCKKRFENGSAEFFLVVGGSISFTVKDDDFEDGEHHFLIRAFSSMQEACSWATEQTAVHINR